MDIDIDTPSAFDPRDIFPDITCASMVNNGRFRKHPAGVYFQKLPSEPTQDIACVPYDIAPHFDLFKVDFLHLSLLDVFDSKAQIRELMTKDPNWNMLEDEDVVAELFQLKNHYDVIQLVQPRSIQELADCVALIRPGRRYLLDQYKADPVWARRELYKQPLPKGCFKKAHAIAYAFNISLQLHMFDKIKNGFCEF